MIKTSNTKYFGIFLLISTISGCAHSAMRGSVAMKAENGEAHVCMGEKEVKAGDKVALYKSECKGPKGGEKGTRSCERIRIGEGVVERTLNEHYSVVKVNPGVDFQEGTIVEKE